MTKDAHYQVPLTWFGILPLPRSSHVILGHLLKLSELQHPYLSDGCAENPRQRGARVFSKVMNFKYLIECGAQSVSVHQSAIQFIEQFANCPGVNIPTTADIKLKHAVTE